jgi:outer membrane protein OmpA-like peptidoglycan-associated protein
MNNRMSAGRRAVRYAAIPAALALVLSGCAGDDKPEPGKSTRPAGKGTPGGELRPIASMPLAAKAGPAHVDLLALSRTAANTVTARFKIVNDGKNEIELTGDLNELGDSLDPDLGDALAASGIGLLDAASDKIYYPVAKNTTSQNCVCTSLNQNPVKPGGSIDVYATFPSPPASVQKATLVVPLSVPFQDVPITSEPVQPLQGQIDPSTVQVKKPRILNLRSLTEGTEQSVDDDPNDRSVRLSADVLFAVDKADLTPRAEQLLQQVAKQIDASKGATVQVDGHADNTGNDAINQPLSERRAQAVADRLKKLVTRQGVTYKAAGHGSKQPVATNDTDEGRRKNRRVTVLFARPPAPAPPPVSGEPYKRGSSAVLGSATFKSAAAKGLKVEVNSLHRDSSGLTVLVWTLRNEGQGSPDVGPKLEKRAGIHGSGPQPLRTDTTGGVMLYDGANQVRYNSLSTQAGPCICTEVSREDAKKVLGPGESVVFYNAYTPPANAANLEMQVPWDQIADAAVKGLTIR